jgi:acetoacetyl-CoA synthetase
LTEAGPLWSPSPERVAGTRLHAFVERVGATVPEVTDSITLHHWSVRDPGAFWRQVWDDCGAVAGSSPTPV